LKGLIKSKKEFHAKEWKVVKKFGNNTASQTRPKWYTINAAPRLQKYWNDGRRIKRLEYLLKKQQILTSIRTKIALAKSPTAIIEKITKQLGTEGHLTNKSYSKIFPEYKWANAEKTGNGLFKEQEILHNALNNISAKAGGKLKTETELIDEIMLTLRKHIAPGKAQATGSGKVLTFEEITKATKGAKGSDGWSVKRLIALRAYAEKISDSKRSEHLIREYIALENAGFKSLAEQQTAMTNFSRSYKKGYNPEFEKLFKSKSKEFATRYKNATIAEHEVSIATGKAEITELSKHFPTETSEYRLLFSKTFTKNGITPTKVKSPAELTTKEIEEMFAFKKALSAKDAKKYDKLTTPMEEMLRSKQALAESTKLLNNAKLANTSKYIIDFGNIRKFLSLRKMLYATKSVYDIHGLVRHIASDWDYCEDDSISIYFGSEKVENNMEKQLYVDAVENIDSIYHRQDSLYHLLGKAGVWVYEGVTDKNEIKIPENETKAQEEERLKDEKEAKEAEEAKKTKNITKSKLLRVDISVYREEIPNLFATLNMIEAMVIDPNLQKKSGLVPF